MVASLLSSKSNGQSSNQSDKAAALAYLKHLKAGEEARRPEVADTSLLSELDTADIWCKEANGDLDILNNMYLTLASMVERGKLKHPLFAEVVAEEEEQIPAGTLYSEIEHKPIRWLWPGRIAFGKLTTLDGDPNYGKSSILCDIAARYSRGRPMPEEREAKCPAGGVVLVMMEDDPADTNIDRLSRVGADLSRISHLGEIPAGEIEHIPITRSFNLQKDVPLLVREIKRIDAGLVVLDPLAGLIGKASTNEANEMYNVLDPLAAIARVMGVAVVFTRHLNKQQSEGSLYRGSGSMAIIGRARIGLIVSDDPLDDSIKVLANHKNNIAKHALSLSYQIKNDEEQGDNRPYIVWKGINKHSSKELFDVGKKGSVGANRLEIVRILEQAGASMTPGEVWRIMAEEDEELEYENVKKTMARMGEAGQLKKEGRGNYAVPSVPSVPLPYELGLQAVP